MFKIGEEFYEITIRIPTKGLAKKLVRGALSTFLKGWVGKAEIVDITKARWVS